MNFAKEHYFLIGIIFGFIAGNYGQPIVSFGCPVGWTLHDVSCYKFVDSESLVYEEADAACSSDGATLVSVNLFKEHQFISDWLVKNNAFKQSNWFTSGFYFNGVLLWEGDSIIDQTGFSYWVRPPNREETYDRVVYTYTASGYKWTVASASIPANYICEIPQTKAASIDILAREFDYGLGILDPRDVKRGPVINQQPDNILIIDGAVSVEIECAASGNDYPTYSWYMGNGYDSNITQVTSASNNRYTLSSGRLSIQNPSSQDIGRFHCTASNQIGTVVSEKAQLIYGFLEGFSNIDPQPVYASAFKGTKMDCNAPAHSPGVGYEWFKNFATNIFVWPSNSNMFVSQSGSLYFSEVQPTDANKRYYCVVSLVLPDDLKMAKAHAPSRSNLGLKLLLSDATATDNDYGPIINTHAFPSPALRGRTIRLECIAYGSHPLFYTWRRQNDQPFVPGTVLSARNRVLTIKDATLEAEGVYLCKCTRGTGSFAEEPITVTMETKPYFPFSIKDKLVDPGMKLEWHCKAVARPAATYTWYKDGKLLSNIPGRMEIKGNVLRIAGVDSSQDEGMYQCGATNQHGTTFSTGQLKVLSFKPNFDKHPLPAVTLAPLRGNISIPCTVEAAPVPEVRWLKNGNDLSIAPGDTAGRIGMDARYGLVIGDVQYSDQGIYQCVATNANGDAKNNTAVQVIEGIALSRTPTDTPVTLNRTAFLYCEASFDSGRYDLTYLWKFNGREINPDLSPEYVNGRKQGVNGLYITMAQYKNEGNYECEAKTVLHSVKASAYLNVQGPPKPPAGVYADDESITERSVRLVWTVTAHQRPNDVTYYDIEGETNFKPGVWTVLQSDIPAFVVQNEAIDTAKRSDQRAYTVTDLIPNTSYKFRVRGINNYGRSQEASKPSSAVRIAQTKPVLPPSDVGGGGGTVQTLTITWTPLDVSQYCGPGIRYNVYWKRVGDTRDWMHEVADGDLALKEGTFVTTVGENDYYLQYQVKVGAKNNVGDGPNSTMSLIYSSEGMPISVPTMKDTDTVNGTSIMVYWEPVPDNRENMKGRVNGYRIHYYEDKFGESAFDSEPDPVKNEILVKDVYGQTDECMLIGLQPLASYYVRVQVFNTAGAGPKGEWRFAETANLILSQYPTHVKVLPHTRHSIRVQWRGVSIRPYEESLNGYIVSSVTQGDSDSFYRDIVGFSGSSFYNINLQTCQIRVWKVQEDVRTAKDIKVDKVMEAVVDGLQIHTVYELRILGYSSAGDGAISEAVFFTVLGGTVDIDPTTSQVCYVDAENDTCAGGVDFKANIVLMLITVIIASVLNSDIGK